MASCSVCFGNGTLTNGRFAPCSRCGGIAIGQCRSCNGSGTSNKELREECWSCQGTGNIANASGNSQPLKHRLQPEAKSRSIERVTPASSGADSLVLKEKKTNRGKVKPVAQKSNSGLLTGLSIVLAILAGLVSFQLEADSGVATGVAISTFIAANIVLRILGPLLAPLVTSFSKPAFVILLLTLAIVIGNLAEIDIARDIFAFIESIIDDLN